MPHNHRSHFCVCWCHMCNAYAVACCWIVQRSHCIFILVLMPSSSMPMSFISLLVLKGKWGLNLSPRDAIAGYINRNDYGCLFPHSHVNTPVRQSKSLQLMLWQFARAILLGFRVYGLGSFGCGFIASSCSWPWTVQK